jgi:hypothetical protein
MIWTEKPKRTHPYITYVTIPVNLLALAATWLLLFIFLAAWTEIYLVPWDLVATAARPIPGTLPRILNDFFEGLGSILPATLVIGFNIVVLVRQVVLQRLTSQRLWHAIRLNLLLMIGLCLTFFIAIGMNSVLFGSVQSVADMGYHRSLPAMILSGAVFAWYGWQQMRLGSVKYKRQHPMSSTRTHAKTADSAAEMPPTARHYLNALAMDHTEKAASAADDDASAAHWIQRKH